MKTFKLSVFVLILLISNVIFAQKEMQNAKTPEERAKNQTKILTKACNLTEDQQLNVEKVLLNSILKLKELRSVKPTKRGERLAEIQAVKENQNTEIKKILSEEQYNKYLEVLEKQKERIKENRMENRHEAMESIEN